MGSLVWWFSSLSHSNASPRIRKTLDCLKIRDTKSNGACEYPKLLRILRGSRWKTKINQIVKPQKVMTATSSEASRILPRDSLGLVATGSQWCLLVHSWSHSCKNLGSLCCSFASFFIFPTFSPFSKHVVLANGKRAPELWTPSPNVEIYHISIFNSKIPRKKKLEKTLLFGWVWIKICEEISQLQGAHEKFIFRHRTDRLKRDSRSS